MPNKKEKKFIFNENWLVDERFKDWLAKSGSKWNASCKFCMKDFDISNMGVAALTSHGLGKKHLKISESRKSQSGVMFFTQKAKDESGSSSNVTSTGTLNSMVVPVNSLRAEIL